MPESESEQAPGTQISLSAGWARRQRRKCNTLNPYLNARPCPHTHSAIVFCCSTKLRRNIFPQSEKNWKFKTDKHNLTMTEWVCGSAAWSRWRHRGQINSYRRFCSPQVVTNWMLVQSLWRGELPLGPKLQKNTHSCGTCGEQNRYRIRLIDARRLRASGVFAF